MIYMVCTDLNLLCLFLNYENFLLFKYAFSTLLKNLRNIIACSILRIVPPQTLIIDKKNKQTLKKESFTVE